LGVEELAIAEQTVAILSRRFAERDGKYDELYKQSNDYAAKREVERAAQRHDASRQPAA
jgi:hypothetical protein